MSSDNLSEIIAFFTWYKSVYGRELYSDVAFGITDIQLNQEKEKGPYEQPRVSSLEIENNGISLGNEYLLHQEHPLLKSFYNEIYQCTKCSLAGSRHNFVFGMGNPNADVMFIGEAPGQEEDLKGLPFVGRAGQLLDKMLFALGQKREDVFIANVLKCRPPNNRDPLADEVQQCEPYLIKQISIIQPKIIIALGRISAQVLLKKNQSLSNLRQENHTYQDIPFIVTYHPAALLRNPEWKAKAWIDLKKVNLYLNT